VHHPCPVVYTAIFTGYLPTGPQIIHLTCSRWSLSAGLTSNEQNHPRRVFIIFPSWKSSTVPSRTQSTSCVFFIFFLAGMLAPGSMAITELSIILLSSGEKNLLVTKPDEGNSTSPGRFSYQHNSFLFFGSLKNIARLDTYGITYLYQGIDRG